MITVFLLSVALSFLIAFIYRIFIDQEKATDIEKRIKELNEKMKKAREENNQKDVTRYSQELMKTSGEKMRMQFKPMIITFIIIIPIFTWVGPALFGSKPVVNLPFTIFGHDTLTWIWWYIIVSFPMGLIFRKLLDVK